MRRAPFQLNCSAGKHSQNDRMDGKLTCTMQDFFFFAFSTHDDCDEAQQRT
jgi:hypothetical protein